MRALLVARAFSYYHARAFSERAFVFVVRHVLFFSACVLGFPLGFPSYIVLRAFCSLVVVDV